MDSKNNAYLENAIMGRYDFHISRIFSEAWQKTKGIKATYWKALVCIIFFNALGIMLATLLGNIIEGPVGKQELYTSIHPAHEILTLLVAVFLTTPLSAGLWVIMIRHCGGRPTNYRFIFHYFSRWKQLSAYPVIVFALQWLQHTNVIFAFIALLLIIYFSITYSMFIPLVGEKNLPTWKALETSRKTISHHWFKMCGFFILIILIFIASLFTLGIALIWTLPWGNNALAVLYKNMFGVDQP
jgi:hypothetical protein